MNRPGDSAEQHGWAPELSQLPGLRPHSEAGGHAAPGPAAVGGALPDLYTLRCIYFKHYLFFSSQCLYSLLALKLPTSQPRCCVCVCVCVYTHTCARTHTQLFCELHDDYNVSAQITFMSQRVIFGSQMFQREHLLTCPIPRANI